MKYIIMAGGNYNTETPKQLSKVNGEVLIERTIRLLKENGINDIYITTNNKRFDYLDATILKHENKFECKDGKKVKGYWLDAFYPSEEAITYLYGDVYYSPEAIKTIVETKTDGILFFASKKVNRPDYFKGWQEPFAFKVVNQKKFRYYIDYCKSEYEKGHCNREPISWELYRVINGYGINEHIMRKNFIAIDDYTTDIDTPGDIKKLEGILLNYQ